jgi:hypothetical protein
MTELTLEQMKANRKLWVEALRSGEYKQTKEALKRKSGGMCCLGVLCDLAGEEWNPCPTSEGKILPVGASSHVATKKAMAFVGLRGPSGVIKGGNSEFFDLAAMNDAGKRFKTIAKIIESEPPGLFVESVQP